MDAHERPADHVFLTTWSDKTRLVVNYGTAPYVFENRIVAPMDYALLAPL